MHRDEREEETKKEAGEGWRGPIPHLIESSFGKAGTSLKNEGVFCRNKKKKNNKKCRLFILHHHAQKTQRVYLFYRNHRAPEHSF